MKDGPKALKHTCPHCGAVEVRRLGECSACGYLVCDACGNVQFSGGERKAVHKECLHQHDGGFTMIKFVR